MNFMNNFWPDGHRPATVGGARRARNARPQGAGGGPDGRRAASVAAAAAVSLLSLAGCDREAGGPSASAVAQDYVALAEIVWADALAAARELETAVEAFLEAPSEGTLAAARDAWREARVPYSQSEAFRFGNPVVDAWEPQVNAWPLDEGFIDYVDESAYAYELGNAAGRANLVASPTLLLGGEEVDLSTFTPTLLAELNEAAGSEANVATGWHAIEFLLWGQDLNGTGPGAGRRPASDFASGEACTHGHCDRRREYLATVTDLLVLDLEWMHEQWASEAPESYRAEFLALPPAQQLTRMLYALGSLSLGELAGERMKVALFANSTEDEHDCFSDNTHVTLYYNALGIANVLRGEYRDRSGELHRFESLLSLTRARDPALAAAMSDALAATEQALAAIVASARDGQHFDQLIAPGNEEGAAIIQSSIDALVAQTGTLERMATTLGIDSLEPDDADHRF